MFFFGLVLSIIATLLQVYVFFRASSVPAVRRRVPLAALLAVGLLLWGMLLAARLFHHSGDGVSARVLQFFGMNWLAALFLMAVPLLAVDIVTLFGFALRRQVGALRGWALVAGAVMTCAALVQGLRAPVLDNYEVRMAELPAALDGTVVVGFSDLHVSTARHERWLSARIDQVAAAKPDMIVLLGDIFEGHNPPPPELINQLHRLQAPLGVWAVVGNHERYGAGGNQAIIPEEDGIKVLHNCWGEAAPGLIVAGVDDLTAQRRSNANEDLVARALGNRGPGATIFLSHTPWQAEEAAQFGAGLMLSAHTHGGQIWPFGYLVRHVYPLLSGQYDVNGMSVIVCRGTGTWGPTMRLWRPGEILRITLRRA